MDCDNVITKSAQHSHARMIAIIDLSLAFFNNNIYIYCKNMKGRWENTCHKLYNCVYVYPEDASP